VVVVVDTGMTPEGDARHDAQSWVVTAGAEVGLKAAAGNLFGAVQIVLLDNRYHQTTLNSCERAVKTMANCHDSMQHGWLQMN
jgi:hypothetical protein